MQDKPSNYRIECVDRSCGGKLKVPFAERWFACVFRGDELVHTTRRSSYKRHAKGDASWWIERTCNPRPAPQLIKVVQQSQPPTVRDRIHDLPDTELIAAAVRIAGSPLFDQLRLSRWQREFLVGLPKHFEERALISWAQRRSMRMTLQDVVSQLHARRFVAELKEETAKEVEEALGPLASHG